MRIGTPLSATATRVMLLGSGELGKEVIIALQRLGVEVIAVDRYPDAPGHQLAHRAHVINMADPAALRALVEQERPQLVGPEIEPTATESRVEIEAARLAEASPTARTALWPRPHSDVSRTIRHSSSSESRSARVAVPSVRRFRIRRALSRPTRQGTHLPQLSEWVNSMK